MRDRDTIENNLYDAHHDGLHHTVNEGREVQKLSLEVALDIRDLMLRLLMQGGR